MEERRRISARDKGKAKIGEPSREDEDFLPNHRNIQDRNQPDHHDHDHNDEDDEDPVPVADDQIPNNPINAPPNNSLDQILGNVPWQPGSRDLSADHIFISKILTSSEADPTKSVLYIDRDKAQIMVNNPTFDLVNHCYIKTILVFDLGDRPYLMNLSKCTKMALIKYVIEGVEWQAFLRLHRLKGGDEITIYRIFDRKVSHEHYYVLRFVNQPRTKVKPNRNGGARKKTSGDGGGDSTRWQRIGW